MPELERETEATEATEIKTSVRKKKKHRRRKKHMSVGKMVLLDLLAIIVGLNVFALFHHVLDYWGIHLSRETAQPVVVATLPTAQPAVSAAPAEETAPPESAGKRGRAHAGPHSRAGLFRRLGREICR